MNNRIDSYKELIVWQKSIKLVKEVFILTEKFPKSEIYGISSQIKRAAVSIPSNIAEGNGRNSRREYSHSLSIAFGSGLELETQCIIAKERKFIDEVGFLEETLLDEILRMLNSLRKKMKQEAVLKT